MKRFTYLAIACLLSISAFGQRDRRNHSGFDAISLGYPAHLIITQGDKYSVELEGDSDDLEDIRTEVRGSTLVIKNERNSWFSWNSSRRVKIYVTLKDFRSLSVSGSGRAENNGKIVAGDLDLDVSGSGRIELSSVQADDVSIDISGSGSVQIDGSGDDGEVDISGSGRLFAEDFEASSFNIEISGSGGCKVNVSRNLDASISGSGSVYYRGEPDKVRSSVSGSGRVRKM